MVHAKETINSFTLKCLKNNFEEIPGFLSPLNLGEKLPNLIKQMNNFKTSQQILTAISLKPADTNCDCYLLVSERH